MKILFLDIDGVLNSRRSAVAFKGYPYANRHKNKFDRVAVELIRKVCKSGVDIVLSSTWRFDDNYKEILGLPIIDRTPCLDGARGKEIARWISENGEPERWAIIDDDSDMLPEQIGNFVHVSGIDGLLWKDYERLCTILDVAI